MPPRYRPPRLQVEFAQPYGVFEQGDALWRGGRLLREGGGRK